MKKKAENQDVKARRALHRGDRLVWHAAPMKRVPAGLLLTLVVLMSLLGACAPRAAYPERPVTFIVPFPPGGGGDVAARILAEATKAYFPQPVTVVNKPGAGGITGVTELFQAAPDGYTIGHIPNDVVTRSPLEQSLPFKGPDDFQYIISGTTAYFALLVKSDSPWKTFQEMAANANANPGKVRIASQGLATGPGTIIEWVKASGVQWTQVPFDGSAPSMTAVLGGHVEGVVGPLQSVMSFVKAGQMRFLLVFAGKRLPLLPDVPASDELGYKLPVPVTLTMVYAAPKGTPKEVMSSLNEAFKRAEESERYQKWVADSFVVAPMLGPEETLKMLRAENDAWTAYLKKSK